MSKPNKHTSRWAQALSLTGRAIVCVLAFTLCACTDGNEDTAPTLLPQRHGPILFGQPRQAVEWVDGRSETRAATDILADLPNDIGVFAFGDGPNTTYIFRNQRVFYKEGSFFKPNGSYKYTWNYTQKKRDNSAETEPNLWPYTTDENSVVPRYWDNMHYRFFAYSPWTPDSQVKVEGENYATFNTFRWDNIPGFAQEDYMLANDIREVNNTGHLPNGSETPTMTTPDAVWFNMRHIFSRLRLFFKLNADYRTLRKIELNSVTVLNAGKVKSATFNFKDNTWDETVHWSNEQPGVADPVTLYNEDPDYEVPIEYPTEPFASVYVYPQTEFRQLRMRLNYSVYDSRGVKTRQATVTNDVNIKGTDGTGWELKSGYYYDVKIYIVPDYLYVLSDNDEDYDEYIILNDE